MAKLKLKFFSTPKDEPIVFLPSYSPPLFEVFGSVTGKLPCEDDKCIGCVIEAEAKAAKAKADRL